jgi:hypothetical protein
MKAEAFAKSIDELYERLRSLTASKGEEYKRREDNQFANFERGAQALGLTREQVLMVYLSKHLDSIVTYVKDRAAGQEKVYAEPISGRIDDAILYLLLLRGMTIENDEAYGRRVAAALFPGETFEVPEFAEVQNYGGDPDDVEAVHNYQDMHTVETQRAMEVGGVTTPRREVQIGVPILIMSSNRTDAINECRERNLPVGTCALMYPDQLYGRKEGHVIFIHHGNATDDAMAGEVKRKCEEQGLTFELLAK